MNRLIFKIINSLSRHRVMTGIVLFLVILLAGARLFTLNWNNSIELMLPQDSDVTDAIYFLQDSQLAGKILLSFTREPSSCSLSELLEVTDEFVSDFDPNLVSGVVKGFSETEVTEDVFLILQRVPELLGPKDFEALTEKTGEEEIEKSLRSKFTQLMSPQGSFFSEMFQRDPLNIQTILQDKILRLSNSFGYDIQLSQGRLVSSDKLHTLMILDTPVSFTDSVESKILVDSLESKIKKLPQGITADMLCSHTHTVSNQTTIQRDIQVTFTITGIAFLILFVFYFRDYRAGIIFALPMGAVVLAANLTALVTGTLSPIVMGLGSVIIGIAVDYGIHIYTAIRVTRDANRAIKEVMKPLLIGALTTLSVFMAFLACNIPMYQYLAWFAFFGLLLALFGALVLLPVYINPKPLVVVLKSKTEFSKKQAITRTVIFLILLSIGLWGALGSGFESDITQLDGVAKKYVEQEQNFQDDWGSGQEGQALAVVQDKTFELALQKNDLLYTELRRKIDDEKLASLSVIWKSEKERQNNTDRWNEFWSDERINQVKDAIAKKSEIFGFTEDAFEPFWNELKYSVSEQGFSDENALLSQFKERFVMNKDGVFSIITMLDDTKENIAILNSIKNDISDMKIISNRNFSERMTVLYNHELMRIVMVALILVVVLCFAILRDIRMTLFSLVPIAAASITILAVVHWMGHTLNVAHLMACIVVIGLCIDYGVFVVYSRSNKLNVGTNTAVTLSAGTTLIGAGSLLFAQHPTLFYVGSTVVIGITTGYLVSMLVVPALCTLFPVKENS